MFISFFWGFIELLSSDLPNNCCYCSVAISHMIGNGGKSPSPDLAVLFY